MNVKRCISESFERLLEKKSFENITIQDIADESEISRATFYRNFRDKYELMSWVYQKELDKFNDMQMDNDASIISTKILSDFIYSKKHYFSVLFKIEGQNSFTEFLAQYSIEFTKNQLRSVLQSDIPEEIVDSTIIYCYGCANYLKHWAIGGYKKSPKEITDVLVKNIPDDVARILH